MKKIILAAAVFLTAFLLLYGYRQDASRNMAEEIAGKIIRFHVRANSDTQLDQELKLKVRDAIGACMQPVLSEVSGIQESRQAIHKNLSRIEREAEQVIQSEGFDYPVKAELAKVDFPEPLCPSTATKLPF